MRMRLLLLLGASHQGASGVSALVSTAAYVAALIVDGAGNARGWLLTYFSFSSVAVEGLSIVVTVESVAIHTSAGEVFAFLIAETLIAIQPEFLSGLAGFDSFLLGCTNFP